MKSFVLVQWFTISKFLCFFFGVASRLMKSLLPLLSIRLLELVAEDAALEDTIYHLGRGLNSETANIDLDQFLKVSFPSSFPF